MVDHVFSEGAAIVAIALEISMAPIARKVKGEDQHLALTNCAAWVRSGTPERW